MQVNQSVMIAFLGKAKVLIFISCPYRSPAVFSLAGPKLSGTRDQFSWKTVFPDTGGGGMVSGWFKCIASIAQYISNLMLPLM